MSHYLCQMKILIAITEVCEMVWSKVRASVSVLLKSLSNLVRATNFYMSSVSIITTKTNIISFKNIFAIAKV